MGAPKVKSTSKVDNTTKPLDFAIPNLENISGQVEGLLGNNVNVNDSQKNALQGIVDTSQGLQPQLNGILQQFLGGGNVGSEDYRIKDAADFVTSQLNPIASGQFLDPTQNPQLQKIIQNRNDLIRNQVGSQFAGAGRSFSGAHLNALANAQAHATDDLFYQDLQNQQARQLGALAGIFNTQQQTAQNLNQSNLSRLGIIGQGATDLLPLATTGDRATLSQQNILQNLPIQNLGSLSNIASQIAQLGHTQKGTVANTQSQSGGGLQTALGAGLSVAGLLTGNPLFAF